MGGSAAPPPGLDGDQALERAEKLHVAANEARRSALSPTPGEDAVPDHGPLKLDFAPPRRCAGCSPPCARADGRLRYDAGSLRLFAEELLALVQHGPPPDERR